MTDIGSSGGPYLWENGQLSDLGNFGASAAEVMDMNERGDIVGWLSAPDNEIRAFLAIRMK